VHPGAFVDFGKALKIVEGVVDINEGSLPTDVSLLLLSSDVLQSISSLSLSLPPPPLSLRDFFIYVYFLLNKHTLSDYLLNTLSVPITHSTLSLCTPIFVNFSLSMYLSVSLSLLSRTLNLVACHTHTHKHTYRCAVSAGRQTLEERIHRSVQSERRLQ
jgi:hypothetical protein